MINPYCYKGLLLFALLFVHTSLFAQSNNPVLIKDERGNISFATFKAGNRPSFSQSAATLHSLLSLKAEDELRKVKVSIDQPGFSHERYQQYYKGVKVEYGTYMVHAKNGAIETVNGEFHSIADLDVVPSLSEAGARLVALDYVHADSYMWQNAAEEAALKKSTDNPKATYFPSGELVVVEDHARKNGAYTLAYKFDIYARIPLSRAYIYVDAHSGEVVHTDAIIKHANEMGTAATRYSGTRPVVTTSYNGIYYLVETTRGSSIETYNMNQGTDYSAATYFTDLDNSWTEYDNAAKDNAALDAHWGAAMTYDYWKNMHGRNSYDDMGSPLLSYVHYSTSYNNAFWDGQRMTYGDGSGTGGFNALTSLDVVAHEIGHAVCSYTCNLIYSNESGALNEGFSDIWGACVEAYSAPEKKIWLIGEDIEMRTGRLSLRSMENPNATGQPDTYKGTYWYYGTGDYGGVHTNSGVMNHWFYLLSTGKAGTNDLGNSFNVIGIGIDKAAKIAFRAENWYLTSGATYTTARTITIQAAVDLYGLDAPEVIAVTNAWYAVGVGAAYGNSLPPSLPITYCPAKGNSVAAEWIDLVQLGSLNRNSAADAGYYDGTLSTVYTTTLNAGMSGSIYLSAGFGGASRNEYWRVWIDYNQDGNFSDVGELVINTRSKNAATFGKTFSVPATAKNGNTRMRVAMKYGAAPGACETFAYGEVEDYTVTIVGGSAITGGGRDEAAAAGEENRQYGIYPNPVTDRVNIMLPDPAEGALIKILGICGAEVYSSEVSGRTHTVNLAGFSPGVYIVTVTGNRSRVSYRLIKQ